MIAANDFFPVYLYSDGMKETHYTRYGGRKPGALYNNHTHGFTLIELSVVLVVISLLIAGVLESRVLIRQSQVNSVMTDEQQYVKAALNFQQKYGALPGDMPNATGYWGAMTACPPTPGSTSAGGTATCNGNGTGQVDNGVEDSYFWQHLANAQMIPGYYTGYSPTAQTVTNALYGNVGGVNVPQGRIDGSAFGVFYASSTVFSQSMFFPMPYGHVMFFGLSSPSSVPDTPILTAREAEIIDNKYDDGLPGTGNITTWLPSYTAADPNCATTGVASTALYNVNGIAGTTQCSLIFTTGF